MKLQLLLINWQTEMESDENFKDNPQKIEENYKLKDYLKYKKQLEDSADNNREEIIFNDSFVHAEMVTANIFRYAKSNKKEINMYCGKFSLFRDSAKRKIDDIWDKVKPEDSKEIKEWENNNPYDYLMNAFDEYMKDGGYINVILEKDISDITTEIAWTRIERFSDNLKFKKLGVPVGLNHFIVAGKSYRRENNDIFKTAICCFNDEETCNALNESFQFLSILSDNYNPNY